MEEPDKKRIQINFRVIVQNVRPSDIADFLFQNEVIDLDDMEMIGLPALTSREKMIKLLRKLYQMRGSFSTFCNALDDIDMEWLVVILKETEISQNLSQDQIDATELDLQEKLALQEKILNQQSQFIDTLIEQKKANTKNGASTPPVSEMTDLKKAMKEQGLSEEQVVSYIEDFMKRKSQDDTDSAAPDTNRPRSASNTPVNFTETVAITTAIDAVKYLAYSEDKIKSKQLPKPNVYQTTMRGTVDELILRHRKLFEDYVSNESSVRQGTGINFLLSIADEIFRDGQKNWGRIIALYAFGGWLAKHGIFERQDSVFDMIGDVLGFYVAKNLGEWIDSNGGWDSFVKQFPKEAPQRSNNYWTHALVGLGLALGTGAVIAIASRQ